jgi:hypothetical protein
VSNRDSWAEWHYFNVLSGDGRRWAFISLIVAGDVTSTKWGGSVSVTLREQEGASRKYESIVSASEVRFSTTSANLSIGPSSVTVLPNGDYRVVASAPSKEGDAPISIDLVLHPAPRAYFPGASLGTGDFVSGYTVPGLRASANGRICVGSRCETYDGAQSYHDHNWGVWRGVTWDWGASRAGEYTILYGRVIAPDRIGKENPLFVYLIDAQGFRAVMRPSRIAYEDGRSALVQGRRVAVPSRVSFADVRGADTLRVELTIEDAIATDTRQQSRDVSTDKPYFIQMKGTARVSGRLSGSPVSGEGKGFFETYR